MSIRAHFSQKIRPFGLLALAAAALALAACTATPTPALDTATPLAAPPSATVPPTLTTVPTATSTATDEPTEPPTATATKAEDTATPTEAASATPTGTEAATATATKTAGAANTPAATQGGSGGQTIYNTVSIWDIASAVDASGCANTFNPPYGLVQITPIDNGLKWHNTVPEDYTFTKVADGVYTYSGPNGIGTGTVNLTVTFTSDTTLTLAQTYTATNDPNCPHIFNQPGTFQYFR